MLLKPAFQELVLDFAAAFRLLTAAIDACEVASPKQPWRHLVADRRVLAALEAGIAAEKQHILAMALTKYLAAGGAGNIASAVHRHP